MIFCKPDFFEYNFKYTQRISSEICFLSRISEEASAAFNFTLDESLSIKHYYHSVLHRLEERYSKITTDRKQFVNSISLVHSIIGDLYFYDEEYNDAALEYLDALQFVRYTKINDEQHGLFLVVLRNMLKLGLTYEKRKTYDAAFEVYQELCYILVNYRTIENEKLGLEEKFDKTCNINLLCHPKADAHLNLKNARNTSRNRITYGKEVELAHKANQNFPSKSYFSNNLDEKICDATDFITELTKSINPEIEKILGKITSFEGVRLVYQPLLAKLQIMEKCMIGGITPADIYRVEMEFRYLQKAIRMNEKYLIPVEFYNKLGDILYYKRGNLLEKDSDYMESCVSTDKCNCKLNEIFSKSTDSVENLRELVVYADDPSSHGPITTPIPCASCKCYIISLIFFIECKLYVEHKSYQSKKHSKPVEISIKEGLRNRYLQIINKYKVLKEISQTDLRILAGNISDIGDMFLSCRTWGKKIDYNLLVTVIEKVNRTDEDGNNEPEKKSKILSEVINIIDLTSIPGIIFQYYLAAKLYKKAHEFRSYVLQLNKILSLFANFNPPRTEMKDNILRQLDVFLEKATRGCWQAYENAQIGEIRRHKQILNSGFSDQRKEQDISLKRISVYTDIEETILLYSTIRINSSTVSIENTEFQNSKNYLIKGEVIDYYYLNQVSPYTDLDTIWNRINRLKFKEKCNYKIFTKIIDQLFSYPEIGKTFKTNECYLKNCTLAEFLFGIHKHTRWHHAQKELIVVDPGFILMHSGDEAVFQKQKNDKYIQLSLCSLLSHLIAESIFCLNEILEVSSAFGKSFTNNHSIFGEIHHRMIYWAMYYEILHVVDLSPWLNHKLLQSIDREKVSNWYAKLRDAIDENLDKWMDNDSLNTLSMVYHNEMAIRRFYSSIETHLEGKSYQNLLENMSYLNDDFNDKTSHFEVAVERWKICQGKIHSNIKTLKNNYIGSKLYDYKTFISTKY